MKIYTLFFILFSAFTVESKELPFNKDKLNLYSQKSLWNNYNSNPKLNKSLDWEIFEYFRKTNKYNPNLKELVAQRTHDAGMDLAINNFFAADNLGVPTNKKVIVIMGSHSKYRNDPWYRKVAHLGYKLTKAGYFVVTGGGPGLMEAAHLGAYMAAYNKKSLNIALDIMAKTSVPKSSKQKQYEMFDYWKISQMVLKKYPKGKDSLGIPTWFYGHEGANAFSTKIAKYFSNALREEKICSIGIHGAIFAPGGPGTLQEIAMDAAQNGYISYNWYSPMIFFNDLQSSTDMIKLINNTTSKEYKKLKMIKQINDSEEVLNFVRNHPPVKG